MSHSEPQRKRWNEDGIVTAILTIRSGEVGLKTSDIPRRTLRRYFSHAFLNPKEAAPTALGCKNILSRETEDSLFTYCTHLNARHFGLLAADVGHLAYRLIITHGMPHPFSNNKAATGNKRLQKTATFSMISSQRLSAARVKSFTPENVRQFFSF
jgi:hypothetical protein